MGQTRQKGSKERMTVAVGIERDVEAETVIAEAVTAYRDYYGDRDLALAATLADAVATGDRRLIDIAAREAGIIT